MKALIKILAIDEHPLYTQGIHACLRQLPVVEKIDTCHSYDELPQKLQQEEPHLIFLELYMSNSRHDGLSICRQISQRYKNIFIAVLSRYNHPQLIKQARESGAHAFFDKHIDPEELHRFVHELFNGQISHYYIKVNESTPTPTTRELADAFELKAHLTRRECEMMNLIVSGKELEEIMHAMCIGYETFRYHHNNLLEKFDLKNDVELALFAMRHKLCEDDFKVNYTPVPKKVKVKRQP